MNTYDVIYKAVLKTCEVNNCYCTDDAEDRKNLSEAIAANLATHFETVQEHLSWFVNNVDKKTLNSYMLQNKDNL